MRVLRTLLSLLLLVTITAPVSAQADLITELLGENATPLYEGLQTDLHEAANITNAGNGTFVLSGLLAPGSDASAGVEFFSIDTGTSLGLHEAPSLNGVGGTSTLRGLTFQTTGDYAGNVLGVGSSEFASTIRVPTVWNLGDITNPLLASGNTSGAAGVNLASENGMIFGSIPNTASFGMAGEFMQGLPSGQSLSTTAATEDGRFAGGGSIIWDIGLDGSSSEFDFSHFETNDGEITFSGVAGLALNTDGSYVAALNYLSADFTESGVAFLDLEQGNLFGLVQDHQFVEFDIWDGQLVAGLNGFDDATLLALGDFSSITLEEWTGQNSLLAFGGLADGSGLLLLEDVDTGGFSINRYETFSSVPEPSSMALLALGGFFAFGKRRRRSC